MTDKKKKVSAKLGKSAKPKDNGGRGFGTTKEWREDNKTITQDFETQKWANRLTPKARATMEETMLDPKSSAVVKKGIAEDILKINKEYLASIEIGVDGKAVPRSKQKRDRDIGQEVGEEARKKTKENGGIPCLSLTCKDTKTGTDD